MSDDDVTVGALLGAAYQAVVHGQSLAAREAVELVRELGFEKDGTAKPFRFAYQRTEATEDGPQVRTVHATVPLLSLVNPPAISIDKAAIGMSLHLISQSTENRSAYTSTSGSGVPAEGTMPRLKGRIVHKSDQNATLTIESTLKQRDLLGSSRLSQLLDAAVSDRDSVWYQVLEQAEAFRTAAAAFIDTVARDDSTGNGVGVREWLQHLWQLKESVTDAVSAYRDGLLEKIPQLHQNWNTQCQKLTWIDRHTEPDEMAQLRRAFIAAARHVWNALLPGKPVSEFGPPTVNQLRDRFKTARVALTAALPPGLTDLLGKLIQLEGDVVQGCIAHQYKQPEAVTATLHRYNETAAEIRKMWQPVAQSRDSRAKQDELAAAATDVWDALARQTPDDFRTESRLNAEEIRNLLDECDSLLDKLGEQAKKFTSAVGNPMRELYKLADALRSSSIMFDPAAWKARRWNPDDHAKRIDFYFGSFNRQADRINKEFSSSTFKWLVPDRWNAAVPEWNKMARQFWGHFLDTEKYPVTDIDTIKSQ